MGACTGTSGTCFDVWMRWLSVCSGEGEGGESEEWLYGWMGLDLGSVACDEVLDTLVPRSLWGLCMVALTSIYTTAFYS